MLGSADPVPIKPGVVADSPDQLKRSESMRSCHPFALAVFASALAGTVVAQQNSAPPPMEKPEFGTAGTSSVRLTAYDFSGIESVPYATTSGSSIGRYPTSPMAFIAGVHVPGGTNITRIELD